MKYSKRKKSTEAKLTPPETQRARPLRPLDLDATLASVLSQKNTAAAGPSDAAMSRYLAVPLTQVRSRMSEPFPGRISFDSWADRSVAELRSISRGHIRRVCFESHGLSLVLVAERHTDGWSFVARVYRNKQVSCGFVLRAGTHRLLPRSQGFYQWFSDRAPRSIRLISAESEIEFEKLVWV